MSTTDTEAAAREAAGLNYDALRATGMTDEQIVAANQQTAPTAPQAAGEAPKEPTEPATEEEVKEATEKLNEPTEVQPEPGEGSGPPYAIPTKDVQGAPDPVVELEVVQPVARFTPVNQDRLVEEVYKRAALRLDVQRRFLHGGLRGDPRPYLKTVLDTVRILAGTESANLVNRAIAERHKLPV